jgi:hypothetical protein
MEGMRSWVLAALFAVCLAFYFATAAETTLTVNKLVQLVQSCTAPEAKGRYPDKQLADYIKTIKLSERTKQRKSRPLKSRRACAAAGST